MNLRSEGPTKNVHRGGFPMLSHKVSSEKNPGWLFYIGDYTTQLYRDYFINHYSIRIPINQRGFHGMSFQGFQRCSSVI